MPADPPALNPPSPARQRKEQRIVQAAERQFAQYGFEGASLDAIASDAGLSRHNLLYYFPSKEALYLRVLDEVLTHWLQGMDNLTHSDSDNPRQALAAYIRAKLRSSAEHPDGAKVFAKEVIAGAPRYGRTIKARVGPMLREQVRALERWADAGLIRRMDFTHLMFVLWSVTQAYAEQQTQFALLLGKPRLSARDYDKAAELITQLVCEGLLLPQAQIESSGNTGRDKRLKGNSA